MITNTFFSWFINARLYLLTSWHEGWPICFTYIFSQPAFFFSCLNFCYMHIFVWIYTLFCNATFLALTIWSFEKCKPPNSILYVMIMWRLSSRIKLSAWSYRRKYNLVSLNYWCSKRISQASRSTASLFNFFSTFFISFRSYSATTVLYLILYFYVSF